MHWSGLVELHIVQQQAPALLLVLDVPAFVVPVLLLGTRVSRDVVLDVPAFVVLVVVLSEAFDLPLLEGPAADAPLAASTNAAKATTDAHKIGDSFMSPSVEKIA